MFSRRCGGGDGRLRVKRPLELGFHNAAGVQLGVEVVVVEILSAKMSVAVLAEVGLDLEVVRSVSFEIVASVEDLAAPRMQALKAPLAVLIFHHVFTGKNATA